MFNPAFIVEGQMEQRIIGKLCPGQPIRRLGCNGDGVAIARVCDFIETQVRTLGNRNHPIIVLFDREERDQTVAEIRTEIVATLVGKGLGDHDIRVFVADRETEDWYLLDTESICDYYGLKKPIVKLFGKAGLARLLKPAVDYHETSIGVELFTVVSKEKIANKCDTFRALIETALEIECKAIGQPVLL